MGLRRTLTFDRTASGAKIHMQTLGALAHLDYNQPRAHSYEQAFQVLRQLGLKGAAREELSPTVGGGQKPLNSGGENAGFASDEVGSWH